MHLGAAAHLLLGDQPPAVPGLDGVGLLGAAASSAGLAGAAGAAGAAAGGAGLDVHLVAGGHGIPLLCGDVCLVQVQILPPSSQAAVAGVLMDSGRETPIGKSASRSTRPRIILISGGVVVGILSNPQRMIPSDCAPVLLLGDTAAHIHHAAHTGALIDPVQELLGLGGAKTSVRLVVQDGDAVPEVVLGVVHEKVRLSNGITASAEMIEAPPLAQLDALLHPGVAGVLHQLGSLSCLDDGKVKVDIAKVQPPLIGADVNASHAHFTFPPYFSERQWRS